MPYLCSSKKKMNDAMVLSFISEWENGSRHEEHINISASRGRYRMRAMKTYPYTNYKEIPNGFQYETPSSCCGSAGKCITTVTLTRGWHK